MMAVMDKNKVLADKESRREKKRGRRRKREIEEENDKLLS